MGRYLVGALLADRHRPLHFAPLQEMAVCDRRYDRAGIQCPGGDRRLLALLRLAALQPGGEPGLHRGDSDDHRLYDQRYGGGFRPYP